MGGGPGNGAGAGRDPVQLLMDAERELRELASELQLRQEPFRDVTAWDARRVWKALDRVRQVLGEGEEDGWLQVLLRSAAGDYSGKAWRLQNALKAAERAAEAAHTATQMCERLPYDDDLCILAVSGTGVEALTKVDELMLRVEDLSGRRCGFAARVPEKRKRYDLASFLNDVSNCVHVIAEWLWESDLPTAVGRLGERCRYIKGADENLLDLCSKWDEKVDWLGSSGAYHGPDYESLTALVDREEASFRVGSSPGHAARVRSDGRLTYYDEDAVVANAVKYLMGAAGYTCSPAGTGTLECEPPGPDVLGDGEARSRLADVLSWVTSADIRMGNKIYKACEERCGEIAKGVKDKEFEKCIDKCWESELQAERERQEASKHDAYIEPHPAALADLDELGIHWHKRWRRRG
jgi:hypothetical protein